MLLRVTLLSLLCALISTAFVSASEGGKIQSAENESQINDISTVRNCDFFTGITEFLSRCLTYPVDRLDPAFHDMMAKLPIDFEIKIALVWFVFVVINAFIMLCV